MKYRDLFEVPEMMPYYSRERSDPTLRVAAETDEHVSTTDSGHKVYRRASRNYQDIGKGLRYTAVNPRDGRNDVAVHGFVFNNEPGAFHVSMLDGFIGGTMKAHDLYHHILHNHHQAIVSDEVQSEGGRKVWRALAEKPDVSMSVRKPVLNDRGQPMKNFSGGEYSTDALDMSNHYSDTERSGGQKNYSRFVARLRK